MNTTITTQIDLLRHGECKGGNIFRGSLDVELSDKGYRQMRHTCENIENNWDIVISSPLKRCARFANDLCTHKELPIELAADLREIHFGDWEGKNISDIASEHPTEFLDWSVDPLNNTISGGENLLNFHDRVKHQLTSIIENNSGKKILIVCHGGVIRVLIAHVLKLPLTEIRKIAVPYANVSRITHFADSSTNNNEPWLQLDAHNFAPGLS